MEVREFVAIGQKYENGSQLKAKATKETKAECVACEVCVGLNVNQGDDGKGGGGPWLAVLAAQVPQPDGRPVVETSGLERPLQQR